MQITYIHSYLHSLGKSLLLQQAKNFPTTLLRGLNNQHSIRNTFFVGLHRQRRRHFESVSTYL
jgi:hypothetical protein